MYLVLALLAWGGGVVPEAVLKEEVSRGTGVRDHAKKQVCIPVGYVPPLAEFPWGGGGGVCLNMYWGGLPKYVFRGSAFLGDVCFSWRESAFLGSTLLGGLPSWSGGGVCLAMRAEPPPPPPV